MEIDYTREFKRNLRQLSRRYRSIQADVKPVTNELEAGNTPGDQITQAHGLKRSFWPKYSVNKRTILSAKNTTGWLTFTVILQRI